MKKVLAMLLVLALVLACAGCGGDKPGTGSSKVESTPKSSAPESSKTSVEDLSLIHI